MPSYFVSAGVLQWDHWKCMISMHWRIQAQYPNPLRSKWWTSARANVWKWRIFSHLSSKYTSIKISSIDTFWGKNLEMQSIFRAIVFSLWKENKKAKLCGILGIHLKSSLQAQLWTQISHNWRNGHNTETNVKMRPWR